MVSVNVAELVIVEVTESVPVTVSVYVPFGGFGTLLLFEDEVPPQAEIANPSEASASTQASCLSLRDDLPRKPASRSPANAISAGSGLLFFGASLPAF